MFIIEKKEGKTKHWAAAIDEAYSPNPHVDLAIFFNDSGRGKKKLQFKIPLTPDGSWEAKAIARMLEETAKDILRVVTVYHERYDENGQRKKRRSL